MPTPSAYQYDLSSTQRLYLRCENAATTVILQSGTGTQQQQSAQQIETGPWSAPPKIYPVGTGAYAVITTSDQTWAIQTQNMQMQMQIGPTTAELLAQLKSIPAEPMQPADSIPSMQMQSMDMPPMDMPAMDMSPMTMNTIKTESSTIHETGMQPMKMGNMQMSPMSPSSPMRMTMGNMSMQMGDTETTQSDQPSDAKSEQAQAGKQKQFCSQCGASISPDDKFCAYCGHRLS